MTLVRLPRRPTRRPAEVLAKASRLSTVSPLVRHGCAVCECVGFFWRGCGQIAIERVDVRPRSVASARRSDALRLCHRRVGRGPVRWRGRVPDRRWGLPEDVQTVADLRFFEFAKVGVEFA